MANGEENGAPGEDRSFKDLFEEPVKELIQAELREFREEVAGALTRLVERIPTEDQLVQKTVEVLKAVREQQIAAAQNGAGDGKGEQLATASAENNAAAGPREALRQQFRDDPLGSLFTVAERAIESYERIHRIRGGSTDPFVFATELAQNNPTLAQFLGGIMAPDSMAEHIPGMMARVGSEAYAAGLQVNKAMSRQRGYNPFPGAPESSPEHDGGSGPVSGDPPPGSASSKGEREVRHEPSSEGAGRERARPRFAAMAAAE